MLVSHQEKIMRGADRLILLDGGRVKTVGTPDEVLKNIRSAGTCEKLRR